MLGVPVARSGGLQRVRAAYPQEHDCSPASRGIPAGVSTLPTCDVASVSLLLRAWLFLTCMGSLEPGTLPSPRGWGTLSYCGGFPARCSCLCLTFRVCVLGTAESPPPARPHRVQPASHHSDSRVSCFTCDL